ncbi:hypothetical protein EZJ49_06205 [Bdellovibrio bacteriovorus]|uniref:hypothetical protein n=1 Tax=Bdellovibrio bacteriovorus TaxID=959 RepID=UPI0021D39AF5|nr:hypothetical protein [Bdellovibrio bacteriovorus]UXR65839.1 hypothetical protein EZJ49_06205 [Bdellovibrio bacteriovorus]
MRTVSACIFSLLALSACAIPAKKDGESLTLTKVEKIEWSKMSQPVLLKQIGSPDKKAMIGPQGEEEVWIYLGGEPRSTRLSVIFNAKTSQLLSANWFFRSNDPGTELKDIFNRYNQYEFTLEPEESYSTSRMQFYKSKNGDLELAVNKKSGDVNSISWEVVPEAASSSKRKPTSH